MVDVDKIEDIRKRARRGRPGAVIARELQFPSLDGLTDKIDAWLEDDVRQWRKQRHTAARVYVRLRDQGATAGWEATVRAAELAFSATGRLDAASVARAASRSGCATYPGPA